MKLLLSLLLFLLLAGCEITPSVTPSSVETLSVNAQKFDYLHYFLTVRQMDSEAIIAERAKLKQALTADQQTDDSILFNNVKLAILYSKTKSPAHNPFDAKAILNKLSLPMMAKPSAAVSEEQEKPFKEPFSEKNQAFLILLHDLLNEQLVIYGGLEKKSSSIDSLKTEITKLEAEITQLEAQIKQLKNIEKTISQRG
ncbi:MAG: hypothetical protein ACSHW0_04395 [Thalassotalea sp.]